MIKKPSIRKMKKDNIILREIADADTDFIVELRNNPEVRKWFTNTAEITADVHRSFLKKYYSEGNDDELYIIESDGKPSGMISLYNISDGKAEWGRIAVHPDLQGRGYGKKALQLIIERAKQKSLINLYCYVKKDNNKAIHLYESLGFETEREKGDEFRMNKPL